MIDDSLQIGPDSLVYGASSFEALNSDNSLFVWRIQLPKNSYHWFAHGGPIDRGNQRS